MQFSYKARKNTGEVVEGVVEALDRFAVARDLRAQNQTPISVTEISEKKKNTIKLFDEVFSHVTLREKIVFINNISGMLSAGLTLYRALEVESNQIKNPTFKKMIVGIMSSVNQGGSFADSLAKYSGTFSALFVSMVRAGEESGTLTKTLKEIGVNLEKTYNLNSKVKGALIYPAVIVFAIFVVAVLMLMFVVPTLTKIFADIGAPLPTTTRFIIGVSDIVANHPIIFLGSILLFSLAVFVFIKSEKTRSLNDRIVISLPIVGDIAKQVNVARTARTLSSLLLSGIEMTRALEVTKDVLQNVHYKAVLERAGIAVQKGETLSSIFKSEQNLYPIMVSEMVTVGEETGALSDMLVEVAKFYEEEVESTTKNLSTIIEPVIMIVIGVAVGFFAVSMISPMYNLLSVVSS